MMKWKTAEFMTTSRCALLTGAMMFGSVNQVSACEPVMPLMQVVAGPGALMGSLTVLIGAVVLKCVSFGMFQRKISFLRSVLYMFAGNVITTVIGFIAAAMIGSGGGEAWLIGLPLVWVLCLLPAKRLILTAPNDYFKGSSASALAAKMTAGLAFSCCLFMLARLAIDADNQLFYWWFKIVAIYVALGVSIVLTAFWEEWVVWKFSRGAATDTSFAVPVLRANLLVLVVVMAIGAALMLPQRLKSPNFLVPEKERVSR